LKDFNLLIAQTAIDPAKIRVKGFFGGKKSLSSNLLA